MHSAPALTHCHGEEATEPYLQGQGTSWNIVEAERKFVPQNIIGDRPYKWLLRYTLQMNCHIFMCFLSLLVTFNIPF
jgi:hypothetical protein